MLQWSRMLLHDDKRERNTMTHPGPKKKKNNAPAITDPWTDPRTQEVQ